MVEFVRYILISYKRVFVFMYLFSFLFVCLLVCFFYTELVNLVHYNEKQIPFK